jgi:hypothetical protein
MCVQRWTKHVLQQQQLQQMPHLLLSTCDSNSRAAARSALCARFQLARAVRVHCSVTMMTAPSLNGLLLLLLGLMMAPSSRTQQMVWRALPLQRRCCPTLAQLRVAWSACSAACWRP